MYFLSNETHNLQSPTHNPLKPQPQSELSDLPNTWAKAIHENLDLKNKTFAFQVNELGNPHQLVVVMRRIVSEPVCTCTAHAHPVVAGPIDWKKWQHLVLLDRRVPKSDVFGNIHDVEQAVGRARS